MAPTHLTELEAENAKLRARIDALTIEAAEATELRARIDALTTEAAELRADRDQMRRICDLSPNLIYLYDLVEQRNVYGNRQLGESLGYSPEELKAMGAEVMPTIGHPDDMAAMPEHIGRLLTARDGEVNEIAYRCRRTDGSWRWLLSRDTTFERSANGSPRLILGVLEDITERRRAENELRSQADEIRRQAEELTRHEAERAALQEQVIKAQQSALRELSTPLLPIADRVLAMPLIGTIDPDRSRRILEVLLEGIVAAQAQVAILDVTGVREANAQVAHALTHVTKAARLLGAEVVLTGISPAVAEALAAESAEFGDTITLGTLQSGITYALGRTGSADARGPRPALPGARAERWRLGSSAPSSPLPLGSTRRRI
ncbi:MAG: PAS domain S-box protein [Polyangiaceae bacterium]|jgi:rsbT co-antagonist protein RsbR|nr:PAS domain S-box protein [Polyangiaceae bacterium]